MDQQYPYSFVYITVSSFPNIIRLLVVLGYLSMYHSGIFHAKCLGKLNSNPLFPSSQRKIHAIMKKTLDRHIKGLLTMEQKDYVSHGTRVVGNGGIQWFSKI